MIQTLNWMSETGYKVFLLMLSQMQWYIDLSNTEIMYQDAVWA